MAARVGYALSSKTSYVCIYIYTHISYLIASDFVCNGYQVSTETQAFSVIHSVCDFTIL